jgi:glycerol-3-phosphate dehydrogenase
LNDYHIVVIGGGGTGAAILYDVVTRGFRATLVERGELTSGTTGRHHGQLHSGARYAVNDREIARECMNETEVLRRIASESIESNWGVFVALTDEDREYMPTFIEACEESGIPTRELTPEQVLEMEPNVNPELKGGVLVPDGTLDAYRLPLQFFAGAVMGGAAVRSFSPVTALQNSSGTVQGVRVWDLAQNREYELGADLVINATGAWAGHVTHMADIDLPLTPAPGTMLAVKGRIVNMIVSHLHPPDDGDIIVAQRGLSIIGSTQWKTEDPDKVHTPESDIETLVARANELAPSFGERQFHAAWTAVRPLSGSSGSEGRELSRDFECIDHAVSDGVEGMVSVTGGKATVLRGMAETTVDLVCRKLGVDQPCVTAERPLPPHRAFFSEWERERFRAVAGGIR